MDVETIDMVMNSEVYRTEENRLQALEERIDNLQSQLRNLEENIYYLNSKISTGDSSKEPITTIDNSTDYHIFNQKIKEVNRELQIIHSRLDNIFNRFNDKLKTIDDAIDNLEDELMSMKK